MPKRPGSITRDPSREDEPRGCPTLGVPDFWPVLPEVGIFIFDILEAVAILNQLSAPHAQTPSPSPDLSSPAKPRRQKPHRPPKASKLPPPFRHFRKSIHRPPRSCRAS